MKKTKHIIIFFSVLVILIFIVSALPTYHTSGTTSQVTEEQLFTYNFTANVTYNPATETLNFSIQEIKSTNHSSTSPAYYSWISLASSTGILTINTTRENETGFLNISITVLNQIPEGTTAVFYFNISAVNDAPYFVGLTNQSFNISQTFSYNFSISDEENNIPFKMNITFINCSTAQWSTRNSTNCTLFNSSQYTLNETTGNVNISFVALKNDVGDYIINFTAIDSGTISPANASSSRIVNFSVKNINSAPYFRYVCDNERNTTENSDFSCWINATDIDELSNLTLTSNYSWFTFNNSATSITLSSGVATNYNVSAMINFTPSDIHVGNWSVNISISDSGAGRNSTVFWFFVNNAEDSPVLNAISNYTIYENKTIYVNATDDDLLVPDKSVKNEVLTFASNLSAVIISSFSSASNYTTARIIMNYHLLSNGNHTVNVNVTDTAGNFASRNFTITVLADTPATWNQTSYTFASYENNNTYLNLSTFVNDTENDAINFSYTNDTIFPSFNLTRGIINFTSSDTDIGQHILSVNASDGKLDRIIQFNFTIYNINDFPFIEPLVQQDVVNATVDANSNINAVEDNYTTITLWVRDDDFKIPINQKGFYNESLNLNLSLQGVNSSLISFVRDGNFPTDLNNRSKYEAVFTPRKADIGSYNVTINISDSSNASTTLRLNLTVASINHNPVLMNLTNYTSKFNASFYLRINASDIEDGNSVTSGNNNLTFSYFFLNGTSFLNSSLFNSSSGEMNITFNSSQSGNFRINITVNDTTNRTNSNSFWMFVYNSPNITSPLSVNFTLQENVTSNLGFMANHSVGDNLTYDFYINNVLRYNLSYYGNNTNLTWSFTPNFTDETYGRNVNLTLIVYSLFYPELNYSRNWDVNISHTSYPLSFSSNIGGFNQKLSGGSPLPVTLSDYFSDIDASDRRVNQTIGFVYSNVSGSSGITVSITNWTNGTTPTAVFSASSSSSGNFSISAYEFNESNSSQVLRNVTSNNFTVELTVSSTSTPVSGGGGGGSTTVQVKLYNLKIILPGEIDLSDEKYIEIPFSIQNPGKVTLSGINLSSSVVFNNLISDNLKISVFNDYISELLPGNYKNLTLRISVGDKRAGRYRATIFANVTSPQFSDWADFYINLNRINETDAGEILIFTEKLVSENPQCLELSELLKESEKLLSEGNYEESVAKSKEVVEACRLAISKNEQTKYSKNNLNNVLYYAFFSALFIMAIWFVVYIYKRVKFNKDRYEGYV